jgi:hypothetical protein
MPAPRADMPWSETSDVLFKILVLKKESTRFAESYTTEIKEQIVTKKTLQNGFDNSKE